MSFSIHAESDFIQIACFVFWYGIPTQSIKKMFTSHLENLLYKVKGIFLQGGIKYLHLKCIIEVKKDL